MHVVRHRCRCEKCTRPLDRADMAIILGGLALAFALPLVMWLGGC